MGFVVTKTFGALHEETVQVLRWVKSRAKDLDGWGTGMSAKYIAMKTLHWSVSW